MKLCINGKLLKGNIFISGVSASLFKTEQLREDQKQSAETVSCTMKRIQGLEVSS